MEVRGGVRRSGGRNPGGLPGSGGTRAESPRVIPRWMAHRSKKVQASRNDDKAVLG